MKARRVATEAQKKLFYKIGEVCSLTDTQPYVLRFWESEFPQLAPRKNRTGQRLYRHRDVEMVLEIKKLLYDEGFTIAGAKKRLEAELTGRTPTPQTEAARSETPVPVSVSASPTPNSAAGDDRERSVLLEVREQLREILTLLDRGGKINY